MDIKFTFVADWNFEPLSFFGGNIDDIIIVPDKRKEWNTAKHSATVVDFEELKNE